MSPSSTDRQILQNSSIWGALWFARKKRPNVRVATPDIPDSETSSTVSTVKEIIPEVENHTRGYRLVIVMAVMAMATFMVGSSAT